MSWFPSFLNIAPAIGAAALVIPTLLILYFLKLRRREMPVSSTFLWKKAIQDLQVNSPFQRLRRNLLLLLQLLLLLLLLLSLARPVTNVRPPAGQMNVILIDRSGSMNARDAGKNTRLEEARQRARELVDSMPKGSTAMVIAFDDSAETVQPLTRDAAALKSAIDSIKPTDRVSRVKLAYQLADAQMSFNPEQLRSDIKPPDVYLFSDGRVVDAGDVTIRGKLHFEKIGSDQTGNVAIVALNAKRNYERPTEVQVFARLANYGSEPVEAPVQLSVDNEVVEVGGQRAQTVFLLPDRWEREQREKYERDSGRGAQDSVTFNLDVTSSAVLKVEQLKRSGDGLLADDVAQVVVPPPRSLAVLMVSDGSNWFLEKNLVAQEIKNADIMRPQMYEELTPDKRDKYDVYIFDRYNPKVLPPAGNFVFILDGRRAELPAELKVRVAKDPQGKTIFLEDVGILDWKRDHPILKDISLGKLYIGEAAKLDVPKEAEVLVDGLKGPLVALSRDNKGSNLIIAFDLLQSTWPLKVSFPIFLHNALQFLAIGSDMDVRQSFAPGATPTISRAALQKVGGVETITLKGPEGTQKVAVPKEGDFALPALNRVGLYTTEPPIPQFETIAVNLLDANESNLLPADRAPGDINAPVEQVSGAKARLELWWWLVACGALPLLLIEWWVYTRRVYL